MLVCEQDFERPFVCTKELHQIISLGEERGLGRVAGPVQRPTYTKTLPHCLEERLARDKEVG
jgi:hypothetical protein